MTYIDSNDDDGGNNDQKNDQELVLWHESEIKYQENLHPGNRSTS